MIFSGLSLGWSVSVFVVGERRDDPYRTLVFVVILVLAAMLATMVGIDANIFLLVYIPWCSCFAMLASTSSRNITGCSQTRRITPSPRFDEKTQLLR
jgi:hypothetical protein